MTATLFRNARLCLPDRLQNQGWLLTRGGHIDALGWQDPPAADAEVVDAGGRILAPGLIDVHAHGAMGLDTMDASTDALGAMARYYAAHGVTSFLATTMAAPDDAIRRVLETVAEAMREGTQGAALLGAHVEGPYLDVDKRGCQDAAQIRCASPSEYTRLLNTGVVRLLTLAPEYPENLALLRDAVARGIRVAAGHTRATYEQMQCAVAQGLSQVTHLYNGMEPLHHRQPGAVAAALLHPSLYVQLIADGVHVQPEMLDLTVRLKGIDRVLLVTDAMAGTGMSDGTYELGGIQITVKGGVARDPDGALAGSTLTLERAVANMCRWTDLPFWKAWRMSSQTPAEAMGWHQKGRLVTGCDADLVLVDDDAHVFLTMVGGETAYRSGDLTD